MKRLHLLPVLILVAAAAATPAMADTEEDTHYSAIIKIDGDEAIADLEKQGVEILRRRDDLLLCYIPLDRPESDASSALRKSRRRISTIRGVRKVEESRRVTPAMDMARGFNGASDIHSGKGLNRAYTGAGVLTGLCDIGFDPSHANFLTPQGDSRIAMLSQYKEGTGERILMTTPEEYTKWGTDNSDEYHATHVAGIMAGSYTKNGYNGMAPSSSVACSTSQLTDVGLLAGAEDILDYARENGMPAVINMSMGSYIGPHDGSSLFCQYLDRIAEEAIVVLSAGNAGKYACSHSVVFSDKSPTLRFTLHNFKWTQFEMYGITDMWCDTDTGIEARIGIHDSDLNTNLIMSPWIDFNLIPEYFMNSEDPDDDSGFGDTFAGWFGIAAEVDSENGRFHLMSQYDAKTEIVSSRGGWARYVLTIELRGPSGSRVDVYADGQYTRLGGDAGFPAPNTNLSFSDLSTGFNTISVGMMCTRNMSPQLDGTTRVTGDVPGTINQYSSYATLLDGRKMPLTCAPGCYVVSSYSSPYVASHPAEYDYLTDKQTVNGQDSYWGICSGTSMSAPFVAGTIATWLEANPTLTASDAQRIIEQTNITDYPDPHNPRHGRGWFAPLEGMRQVLALAGPTTAIAEERRSASLYYAESAIYYENPLCPEALISIYDMAGNMICSYSMDSDSRGIDIDCLQEGIYIAVATPAAGVPVHLKFSR